MLTATLCACTTIPVSVKPELDESLTASCPELPAPDIALGSDIRVVTPKHIALVAKMYGECAASKDALYNAVK